MSNKEYLLKYYSPFEERLNIISHLIGTTLSLTAFPFLILKGNEGTAVPDFFSFIIYGLSLIVLYSTSTLFHSSKKPDLRYKLNILDHVSIFILIAGTYTPYSLITLKGLTGNIMLIVIWSAAIGGIALKLFFTGRFRVLSTVIYVLMGWVAIFAFSPLHNQLAGNGFLWLIIGGVFYTIGATLYAIPKLKFNHAIFHFFVLFGSISHFISIYYYVLP